MPELLVKGVSGLDRKLWNDNAALHSNFGQQQYSQFTVIAGQKEANVPSAQATKDMVS